MNINWIFDLDYTLYHLDPQATKFDYQHIQYDPNLSEKIKSLPGRKLLFTNANVWHTLKCVKMIQIDKTFHKVCCRELAGLKPDLTSYIYFNSICKVKNEDKSFFFKSPKFTFPSGVPYCKRIPLVVIINIISNNSLTLLFSNCNCIENLG